MHLILFYAPVTCALVPYVALTEAGAEFDVRVVNFFKGDHMTEEFLRLNPKHRVPVLAIDGVPLTENVAIQQWIARTYPQAGLIPHGLMDEMQVVSFLAWCASTIHPSLTPNALPQRYCDLPDSADNVRACAQRQLLEHLAVAERKLADQDWFFGRFTTADIYFYWCFRRAGIFGVDLNAFGALAAHKARIERRPSVQKVLAYEADVKRQLNWPM